MTANPVEKVKPVARDRVRGAVTFILAVAVAVAIITGVERLTDNTWLRAALYAVVLIVVQVAGRFRRVRLGWGGGGFARARSPLRTGSR